MEKVGWEIRPLGWLVLVLLAVGLIYFIIDRVQRPPEQNAEKS
jgi:hypothetical protein